MGLKLIHTGMLVALWRCGSTQRQKKFVLGGVLVSCMSFPAHLYAQVYPSNDGQSSAQDYGQSSRQSTDPQSSTQGYGSGQGRTGSDTSYDTLNCLDPLYATLPLCAAQAGGTGGRNGSGAESNADSAGLGTRNLLSPTQQYLPPQAPSDFQRLIRLSTGELLPIFGSNLFRPSQTTSALLDRAQANGDYIVGPGDQLVVRVSGPQTLNSQITVDRSGAIFIPQVGSISVAGLRYDQLEQHVRQELGRVYRNFTLSVNLGQLRASQVFVVGEVRQPGTFSVGPFSTVLTALAAAGGPTDQGSLRKIQLLRTGGKPATLDMYSFLLRGDRVEDIRLQPGDVIVVPPSGSQVALSGSVHHPAIFELSDHTTVGDLLSYGGGLLPTAANTNLTLERVGPDKLRTTISVPMTPEGTAMVLQDGDLLIAPHMTTAFTQTVTLRGNLANPGQFAFKPGMRLSDILPDRMSLLTNDYWNRRNELGSPSPLFQPLPKARSYESNGYVAAAPNGLPSRYGSYYGNYPNNTVQPDGTTRYPEDNPSLRQQPDQQYLPYISNNQRQLDGTGTTSTARNLALDNQRLPSSGLSSEGTASTSPQDPASPLTRNVHRVQIPVPEIDWSYAVIERLNHTTLKSELLPFNLGRLVMDHDNSQNFELQAGDVVTILSQADIPVSTDEQTKFVRIEGEVVSAGVYSVRPGESLRDLVVRAGGLTSKAYLYGSSFYRESERIRQQQNLDQYIASYSLDLTRSSAQRAASAVSPTAAVDPSSLQQRSLVDQLRSLRATGRIVLEFRPDDSNVANIPELSMENNDVFRIPPAPKTVNVIGAVYGQNIFLYNSKRRLADYVNLAGKPNRVADPKHAFVIRADGSIFSRELANHTFSNDFSSLHIYPGDAIVIPEKLIKPSALRNALDYSQILSSFGITAAAISALH